LLQAFTSKKKLKILRGYIIDLIEMRITFVFKN
jgi:hypothetical protein